MTAVEKERITSLLREFESYPKNEENWGAFRKCLESVRDNWYENTCKSCGKVFGHKRGKHEVKYCPKCSHANSVKAFQERRRSSPILTAYQKHYQKLFARKQGEIITEDEFKMWCGLAKIERDIAVKHNLPLEGFTNTLMEIENMVLKGEVK